MCNTAERTPDKGRGIRDPTMRTCKVIICIQSTDAVHHCDHEYCYAALNDRTDEGRESLCSEKSSWCNVEIVSQLHVSDESG